MTGVYEPSYPGIYTMQWHDKDDDLTRWVGNYAESKYGIYLSDCEWLTIEEVRTGYGRNEVVRYVGTIGADHHDKRRTVRFEPGAPPPPTFMRPVKHAYVPSPVEPEWVKRRRRLQWDEEDRRYRMMMDHMLRNVPRSTEPPPPPRYRRNG